MAQRNPKLSSKDLKILRRQKRNRLPIGKITDEIKGAEMVSAIRRCLRHRQESTRSKDTSQSRYRCLFFGCGHSMHADENAAINIGYKWLTQKIAPA
jgi:transposase